MSMDDESAVNREILDKLTDLVKQAGAVGHSIAGGFGITPSDLLALFKLDGVLTMKELAQRMGCDASFVTAIADALERHGLARRAPSERDRRVKHLLLTEEGISVKERMMRELAVQDALVLRARRRRAPVLPRLAQEDGRCRPCPGRHGAGDGLAWGRRNRPF